MLRVASVAASLLAVTAQAPVKTEACKPGEDTRGNGLGVSQGPWTNKAFCDMHEATDSVDNLLDTCNGFCGEANIPLLIGVPTSYGFSQRGMDRVCFGETVHGVPTGLLGEYDAHRMAECKERSEALEQIKEKMAHLVAAVDTMKLEQLRFRAAIAAKIAEFVKALSSPSFELSMKVALNSDKISLYNKFLQAHMEDTIMRSGDDRARLLNAVKNIGDMGWALSETMKTKMPLLEDYAARCGDPMLATSEISGGQYLLDLCTQNQELCIENPGSQHVGCCCGAVPAAGSFTIPADTGYSDDGHRRLLATSTSIDMCAEADTIAKKRSHELKTQLNMTEVGQTLLEQFETQLFEKYPEYFGRCQSSGRRLGMLANVAADVAAVPGELLADVASLAAHVFGHGSQPKGPPKLECTPPVGQDDPDVKETMKTAFWSQTEQDTCDMLDSTHGGKMKTQDLAAVCQDFCGTDSVPLLVGTVAFGFNKSAIDSICVDSSTVTTDQAKVTQCLKEASAMQDVEIKTAAAAASLMALESAKLFYEAAVRAMIPGMKAIIKAEADSALRYATVGNKVTALQKVLNKTLNSVTGHSAAALALKQALKDMEQKQKDLQETLVRAVKEFTRFIKECNQLFTGKGASKEYLLDMCSQTSLECIQEEESRHVGCCCGYMPLLAVGHYGVSLTQTIPGIQAAELSDADGKARVTSDVRVPKEDSDERKHSDGSDGDSDGDSDEKSERPRRLAEAEGAYSICGSAYRDSMETVHSTEKKIKELGQEQLLEGHLAELAERYPGYAFCQVESLAAAVAAVPVAKAAVNVKEGVEAEEAGRTAIAQLAAQIGAGLAAVAFLWAFLMRPSSRDEGLAEPMLAAEPQVRCDCLH